MSKILDGLSGALAEFINRRFITNGIVPAVVLYSALAVHSNGWGETRFVVVQALRDPSAALAEIGWELLVILLLSAIFVAIAPVVLDTVSRVPIPWLREFLLELSMRWRQRLKVKHDLWDDRNAALVWHPESGRFVPLPGSAPRDPSGSRDQILERAADARRKLDGWYWLFFSRRVMDALVDLRLISFFGSCEVAQELSRWRQLLDQRAGKRLDRLAVTAHASYAACEGRLRAYPADPVWMLPTRLGNRLGAIEDYARKRYGIDTSVLMVRLRGVLDEMAQGAIHRARERITAWLNLSVAFTLVVAAIGVTELIEVVRNGAEGRDWRAVAFAGVALVGAYGSYASAVTAVDRLGDLLKQHVDLNRLKTLRALGYAAPESIEAERKAFEALHHFYTGAWSLVSDEEPTAPVTLDPSGQPPPS